MSLRGLCLRISHRIYDTTPQVSKAQHIVHIVAPAHASMHNVFERAAIRALAVWGEQTPKPHTGAEARALRGLALRGLARCEAWRATRLGVTRLTLSQGFVGPKRKLWRGCATVDAGDLSA